QADSATLALFREWARSALAAFGDLQKRCLAEREDEMWRLLDIYSRAVNTERANETRLLTELKETHARIRSLSRTEDLRAARVKLEEELKLAQRLVEQKAREDRERLAVLSREVKRLEAALAEVRG